MSTAPPDNPTPSPVGANELPPIVVPSGLFLVQLFVAPALIVLVIVSVWMMFGWLATKGRDPSKLIAGIRTSNTSRWQYAKELADALTGKQFPELRRDAKSATELAAILENEMKTGGEGDDPILLQVYLAKILGEFEVNAGLPQLVDAAAHAANTDVRLAAIEAISVRAQHVRDDKSGELVWDESTTQKLLELSRSDSELVRSRTAWTLGVVGSPPAVARLEKMLEDPYADARYNAATGLARRGEAAAIEVLIEMLDPKETAGMATEGSEDFRQEKRLAVMKAALDAAVVLKAANSRDDLAPLVDAVKRLSEADLPDLQAATQYARGAYLTLIK